LSSGSGLAPLTLSGIVFKNGMHAIANSGGGLAVYNGAVVMVVACNFQNCEIRGIEGGGGGAIGVFDSGSSLTLTGNIFKDNIVPTGRLDYTADVHAGPGTDVYFNVGDCPEPFSPSLPPVDSAPPTFISFNLAPNQAVLQPPCAFPTQSPTPAPTAEATAAPTHSNWFEDTTVECGFLSLGSTLSHCCDVARDISLVPAGGDARDYVSAAVGVDSSSCRKSLLCGGGGRRRLQPGTGGGQGPPLEPDGGVPGTEEEVEEEEEERQIGFCRELINGAVAEVVDDETAATVSSLMDAQCDVVAITEDIGLAGVECVGEPTGDELLVVADQGDVTMANLLELVAFTTGACFAVLVLVCVLLGSMGTVPFFARVYVIITPRAAPTPKRAHEQILLLRERSERQEDLAAAAPKRPPSFVRAERAGAAGERSTELAAAAPK
jgi:hypothetical protein